MKIAILSANLGNFDEPVAPVPQSVPADYHLWTDKDFPPITGLSGRLQYRIPKTHGWQMFPDYDYYIWMDGGVSLKRDDCVKWYLDQLGDADIALFKHPFRHTIQQEVEHIEEHLRLKKPYITARYKNGLHREQLEAIQADKDYKDDRLYASTIFIYKNSFNVCAMLMDWLYSSVRYFTCDQIALPYLLAEHQLKVKTLGEPIYQTEYMSLVSHHK